MKTQKQVENQAQKLLNYNMKISNKLRLKAENLKYPKTVDKKIIYFNKKDQLIELSKMYEIRGRKCWAAYRMNPLYFY